MVIAGIYVALGVALMWRWGRAYGWLRGGLAAACRVLWTLPLVAVLFPQRLEHELPRTVSATKVAVLVDDSTSMVAHKAAVEARMAALREACLRRGCKLDVTRLSQRDDAVAAGYTPLQRVFSRWVAVERAPWVVVSDGGDMQPHGELAAAVAAQARRQPGLILGVGDPDELNLRVASVAVPAFFFVNQSQQATVTLQRTPAQGGLTVQVQVLRGGEVLATQNSAFAPDAAELTVVLPVPALARGHHLLTLRCLPVAGEKVRWDNERQAAIEVLPDTVGVLHLLGAPSWGGRYVRRYLKSEPKYDTVSFYILRDPWDSQDVPERELSLIPFPVARLFGDELANFRVIVMQDFNLLQFLLPQYQANLVEFIKNGGGLFFIGGERALLDADLQASPLREILPFELMGDARMEVGGSGDVGDSWPEHAWDVPEPSRRGPWYDRDLNFAVKFAAPDRELRALATVYDAWEGLQIKGFAGQGLHHLEKVRFTSGKYTPLLSAILPDRSELPLAVANYPGRGRAVWLFSNDLWRLNTQPASEMARGQFSNFMHGAMAWLLREDLNQPLVIASAAIEASNEGRALPRWEAIVQGPAVRYFDADDGWQVTLCGQPLRNYGAERQSDHQVRIFGDAPPLQPGMECALEVRGTNSAFGAVQAKKIAVLQPTLSDAAVGGSRLVLAGMAASAGAQLAELSNVAEVDRWLDEHVAPAGVVPPPQLYATQDHYWLFRLSWWWVLLLALPFEVLFRRWKQLIG